MNNKYFSLAQQENEASIVIYGNITSYAYREKDVSSYNLSKQLAELDVDTINLYINSYGGEVAEGLAIYNALKRHKAKIKTYCDGFACSISSVIFMAGDERIMSTASLLMIHNAWVCSYGNANELRKQADDLDKVTQASINAYMSEVNITEDELKQLLDDESWLTPQEALEKGFATTIINEKKSKEANQDAKKDLFAMILENQKRVREENIKNKLSIIEASNNEDESSKDDDVGEEPKQNKMGSFFNAITKINN